MSIDVEGFSFSASQTSWNLNIQTKLKAYLTFPGRIETAQFCHFTKAKNNIKEIVLGFFHYLLVVRYVLELLHQ